MIYTMTLNPALDYIVTVPEFQLGGVNRVTSEKLLPGGKGINVSVVLKNLGVDSVVLGFIAGFSGVEIKRLTENFGCQTDLVQVAEGNSRINVKLKAKEETEINAQGPNITQTEIEALLKKLDNLQEGDTLVLAGSAPKGIPSIYADICKRVENKKVRLVVDTTGEALLSTLPFAPFLIKPNHIELEEVIGESIHNTEELILGAKKLQQKGARNILISMAGDGALFVTETGEVYQMSAPQGKVVNSVGAGDSMVAGFLADYEKTKNCKSAMEMAVLTGSASAFSENLATKEEVVRLAMKANIQLYDR